VAGSVSLLRLLQAENSTRAANRKYFVIKI
jgi:hypothetical protein